MLLQTGDNELMTELRYITTSFKLGHERAIWRHLPFAGWLLVGLFLSLSLLSVGRSIRANQPHLFCLPSQRDPLPCALSFLDPFLAAVAPLLSLRITAGHNEQRDLTGRPSPRTRARVLPARPHPTPHSHLPSLMALGFFWPWGSRVSFADAAWPGDGRPWRILPGRPCLPGLRLCPPVLHGGALPCRRLLPRHRHMARPSPFRAVCRTKSSILLLPPASALSQLAVVTGTSVCMLSLAASNSDLGMSARSACWQFNHLIRRWIMKSLLLGGVNSILWTSGGHTHGFLSKYNG
jgi:hypothetical protein